jgi:head-tail adaptor
MKVQRAVVTVGDSGGVGNSWLEHIRDEPCLPRKMSEAEAVRGGRENTRSSWRVYCRAGIDIKTGDRITFTDTTSGAGSWTDRTLDVQGVVNPNQLGSHLQIDCEDTTGA